MSNGYNNSISLSLIIGFYYCDIVSMGPPTIAASVLDSRIQISARSRDIESAALELIYLPPVYVDAKEIVFVTAQSHTAPSTTFEVYGLPSVLQHLTVSNFYVKTCIYFAKACT